jgi:hypothetical protein
MNKRLTISILIILFLIIGTWVAIRFAKGYRLNFQEKKVTETGLLVANSFPTGASVFLDGKLTTATNDTLNLPPKTYSVKIVKDGFIPWEKELVIEKELVTQTNARLFPSVPDLSSITNTGALNLTPSPDGEKLAFAVASASAAPKNGLYIIELTDGLISFSSNIRQIAQNTTRFNFHQTKLVWSPNGKQILAFTPADVYLLEIDRMNNISTQPDVAARLSLILSEWEQELDIKYQERLLKLPEFMNDLSQTALKNLYFSPDEEKLLYTATASAALPDDIIPKLPASNSQPENRQIEPGKIYVYDIKEDKNFYITEGSDQKKQEDKNNDAEKNILTVEQRLDNIKTIYTSLYTQTVQWFPTSNHLVLTEQDKIVIAEYDGTNRATIYAGPFSNAFAFPGPDGSKLLILTTLNPESSLSPNLYAIDLK